MNLLFAIKAMHKASGGAERVLAQVTHGLVERGHQISLMTFDESGSDPFYPLHPHIKRIDLGIGNPLRKATARETLRRIPALRKAVNAEQPDAVIAFMHSMFIPMAFALTGTDTPLIASEHTVPAHYRSRKAEFRLFKLSAHRVNRFTTVSQSAKQQYPDKVQKKMDVIPNPVHTPGSPDEFATPESSKIILTVGRLAPVKNQKTLIRAFAQLAEDNPDWRVRIIGDGPLKPDLESQINDLGIEKQVTLAGTTTNIEAEYKNAAIFALPSTYESFGLATAEAMAHGLPCIGFKDCPGTNELIVHKQTGLLVSRENEVESFAAALKTLIVHEALRQSYGQAGANRISGRYNLETVLDEWERLIHEVSG